MDKISLKKIRRNWHFPALEIEARYDGSRICPAKFNNPRLVYEYFLGQWDMNLIDIQEQIMAMFLNNGLNVIGHRLIGTGDAKSARVYTNLIAGIAINCMAERVIIAHNHPSGTLAPSNADKRACRHLGATLDLVDIVLQDFLIISRGGFWSYRDESFAPESKKAIWQMHTF